MRALLNVADGATAAGAAGDAFAASHAASSAHRAQIASPLANAEIANKSYVDAAVAGATPADNAVSNAKLADVASGTLKGRASANAGDPEDLTAAQVRALLNVADGAPPPAPRATPSPPRMPALATGAHAVATAAAAGFMAAVDKAKLDGIEPAATADQTAPRSSPRST